jgi:hypothetical protein
MVCLISPFYCRLTPDQVYSSTPVTGETALPVASNTVNSCVKPKGGYGGSPWCSKWWLHLPLLLEMCLMWAVATIWIFFIRMFLVSGQNRLKFITMCVPPISKLYVSHVTTSPSVSPGFKAHVGLTTGYLFLLTFTSIVLSMLGAPSDERSGLSFVIVIVRPLLVNIYRFTCDVHVSYQYIQYVQDIVSQHPVARSWILYSGSPSFVQRVVTITIYEVAIFLHFKNFDCDNTLHERRRTWILNTICTRPMSVQAENSRSCSFLIIGNVAKWIPLQPKKNSPNYTRCEFNSRNGPVEAKFAYLCTSYCCRLRNTLLVKPYTSWDDGATAGNSLENRFPEYLAVTSRCVGYQECQQIFVPSGHFFFFFNFRKSQKLQGVESGE